MKIVLAFFLLFQAGYAQEAKASLKDTMKEIGVSMKIVSDQVRVDHAFKADGSALKAAENMLLLLVKSKSEVPSLLADSSGNVIAGKESDFETYKKSIESMVKRTSVLVEAVRNNNVDDADKALKAMMPAMRMGHDAFRPKTN